VNSPGLAKPVSPCYGRDKPETATISAAFTAETFRIKL
jgi:hypothetical protein